jgi:hypothetical protein
VSPRFYSTLNMGVYDPTATFIARSYGLARSLPKTLAAGTAVLTPVFVPLASLPVDELLRHFQVTVRPETPAVAPSRVVAGRCRRGWVGSETR